MATRTKFILTYLGGIITGIVLTFVFAFMVTYQGNSSPLGNDIVMFEKPQQEIKVNEITKNTGIDKVTVLTTVEAFMDAVKASLSKDENVYLRGFGSFVVKKRAQKTARNISKNTTIIIPEHNIPAFKPAKTFTLSVKK